MKTIQLESLKINPNNPFPFEGTEEQWEKFMGVLERDPIFCQANNITYDSTNDNLVIAGNKRLKAFLDLGFTEIPEDYTFDCKDWTEEQRHRYIVASNAAVGKWSQEVMDLHFEGLSMDYGISFESSFGTEQDDIKENSVKEKKDLSDSVGETYEVSVECEDELSQEQLFSKLTKEGYKCRVLTL